MKAKRVIGYICVTAIMGVMGFAIGAGIGFMADMGFSLMGQSTNYFHTVTMGTMLGMSSTLSVIKEIFGEKTLLDEIRKEYEKPAQEVC